MAVQRGRTVNNQAHNPVEEFSYDGLGHRISWKYDTDTDGDVDGSDKTFHMAHDERWRVVATYRESDTTPKEEYFYHAAGDGGMGGSSYIDSVILRDKDANTAWATTACDGVLEQRYYYLQNWRNDTVAMITSGGDQVEGDRYFAAGKSFGMFAGDMDGDGDVDATDTTAIQTVITGGGYDAKADMDRNGTVTTADKTTATANIGINLGIGVGSAPAVFNRKAYAGYERDSILSYETYHVRHRVLQENRWLTRDPIGYVDGPNLYGYVNSDPFTNVDPMGTCAQGYGYEVPNPTSECDAICTGICADPPPEGPFPVGRTGCYQNKPIACVCLRAIGSDYVPSFGRIAECVRLHELVHTEDIDCTNTWYATPFSYGGLPWIDRRCGGPCSECKAYKVERDCLLASDCSIGNFLGFLYVEQCKIAIAARLVVVERQISRFCTACLACQSGIPITIFPDYNPFGLQTAISTPPTSCSESTSGCPRKLEAFGI